MKKFMSLLLSGLVLSQIRSKAQLTYCYDSEGDTQFECSKEFTYDDFRINSENEIANEDIFNLITEITAESENCTSSGMTFEINSTVDKLLIKTSFNFGNLELI